MEKCLYISFHEKFGRFLPKNWLFDCLKMLIKIYEYKRSR